uniref:Uncharacterized protein n=1 Tax=Setaria viridis TaxID=4556 RepID=A0A4U6TTQ4_SETVI|nr:hypothetical protein SEVIR_7G112350v2 [Setaria viridis]
MEFQLPKHTQGVRLYGSAELRVSYKKMNPFCVPFATTNMPRGVFSPFCRIKEDIYCKLRKIQVGLNYELYVYSFQKFLLLCIIVVHTSFCSSFNHFHDALIFHIVYLLTN